MDLFILNGVNIVLTYILYYMLTNVSVATVNKNSCWEMASEGGSLSVRGSSCWKAQATLPVDRKPARSGSRRWQTESNCSR